MSFSPIVPFSGNAGWQFLKSTRERQEAALSDTVANRRLSEHFRDRIGAVTSAAALMEDRQLLTVALGAFGLAEDLQNRAFIRQVLESDTREARSLTSRLSDKRYAALASAFGFGELDPPNTVLSDFPGKILAKFNKQSFEAAVGQVDPDMRLALGLDANIADISDQETPELTGWYRVLGTPPLREVFFAALGLPTGTGSLSVDRQVELLRDKSDKIFGVTHINDFRDPQRQERLINMFLVRSSIGQSPVASGGSVALSLLQFSNGG